MSSYRLETIIATASERDTIEKQLAEAKNLAQGNDELAELAKAEIPEDEAKIAELDDKLFILLTPKDPNDEKNIIIEIRAGAGGDEASLFAAELYRMYLRWCEANGVCRRPVYRPRRRPVCCRPPRRPSKIGRASCRERV